jgi:hypothetical protein
MDKTKTTIISSQTIAAGESTELSDCTEVSLSRDVQLVFTIRGTFNASSDDGMMLLVYPSDDNSTYDDVPWYTYEVPLCVQAGYTAGDGGWTYGEVVSGASGSASLVGWTVTSGDFASADAAGVLYLESVSGTLSDTDALTGSENGSATQDGALAAHAVTRHTPAIAPISLYIKGRLTNKGSESVTSCSLAVTTMDL